MKGYLYTTVISLALFIAVAICLGQKDVNSKQRDDERPRASASGQSKTAPEETFQPVIEVSIIRLIANPEAYDGKAVRVIGVVSIEFEGTAVYLTPDDYRKMICKNAIWLELDKADQRTYRKVDGKYAIIEGVFKAGYDGHFDAFSGSMVKIKRLEALPFTRRFVRN